MKEKLKNTIDKLIDKIERSLVENEITSYDAEQYAQALFTLMSASDYFEPNNSNEE